MGRKILIRAEFSHQQLPTVEIDEETEQILNVQHELGGWWVFIGRWLEDD